MKHVPAIIIGTLLVGGLGSAAQQDTRNQDTRNQDTRAQDLRNNQRDTNSQSQDSWQSHLSAEMKQLHALAGDWKVTLTVNEGAINRVGMREEGNQDSRRNVNQERPGNQTRSLGQDRSMSTGPAMLTGFATRNWELGGHVLSERIYLFPSEKPDENRPGDMGIDRDRNQLPGRSNQSASASQSAANTPVEQPLMGIGMYSFDKQKGELNHAWCDSKSGGIILSMGSFDQGSQTINFREHYGQSDQSTSSRYEETNQSADTQRGGPQSAQQRQPQQNEPLVTVHIVNNDRHVIEMKSREPGGQELSYTITFDRISFDSSQDQWGSSSQGTDADRLLQQRLEGAIAARLRQAGCDAEAATTKAREVAAAIVREHRQSDLSDLEGTLQEAIESCSNDAISTRTQTAALTREVQQMLQAAPAGDRNRNPGSPDRAVDPATKERISTLILNELAAVGADRSAAKQSVDGLTDAIIREHSQGDLDDLEGVLEQLFNDLDVDDDLARSKSTSLARQIRQLLQG